MTINRTDLYNDEVLYLPSANVLSQTQMNSISEVVILEVGDDDTNYNEVLAKSLHRIALVNKAKFAVDEAGIKKERLDSLEIEKFESSSIGLWDSYISSLPDIYLAFGYKGTEIARPIGIKISTGVSPSVDVCPELNTTTLFY